MANEHDAKEALRYEHKAKKALRSELAEHARDHYAKVSESACNWLLTMPHAIDAWEREPELLKRVRELEYEVKFQKECYEEMTKAWMIGLEEINNAEARYDE